jgi:hypothetical protein
MHSASPALRPATSDPLGRQLTIHKLLLKMSLKLVIALLDRRAKRSQCARSCTLNDPGAASRETKPIRAVMPGGWSPPRAARNEANARGYHQEMVPVERRAKRTQTCSNGVREGFEEACDVVLGVGRGDAQAEAGGAVGDGRRSDRRGENPAFE